MSPKGVRHLRVMELRTMALKGKTREDLLHKCLKWRVSMSTANSYINEVIMSIGRRMKK